MQPTRTALYDTHIAHGAKMVDFHGFELPIHYTSIKDEHVACRSNAGLFDVSHMGLFEFEGELAREWLSSISTQDLRKFSPGRCGYTHFLDPDGKIIDDMIFAVASDDVVYGVPNASMIDVVLKWLTSLAPPDGSVKITDRSSGNNILALQGPLTPDILESTFGSGCYPGRFACHRIPDNQHGIVGWIQGTGYTGEIGVEIFVHDTLVVDTWSLLMEAGSEMGIAPVGLGARDTLRLEKGYLLSGQDFLWPGLNSEHPKDLPVGFLSRNTVETNVPYGLSMDHDFLGKDMIGRTDDEPDVWRGMICKSRGPSPRTGHKVYSTMDGGVVLGYITSGAPSPSLGVGIGMGYLQGTAIGQTVYIQTSPRKRTPAEITMPPFV